MRPRSAPALVRRSALALAGAAAAVALAAPAPAGAAESAMPTAQAKAYGMDWVPYIDPADLPPVEQRKVICLVDSGVEVNPDLPADRPEGPIVMRTSVDNTSGLPGDKPEHAHGTSMASMAGALSGNDWGTVGAWPGVRIISMRALSYDRTTFAAGDWRRGVDECSSRAAEGWPVAAINLSLGSTRPMDIFERSLLEEEVLAAQNEGISVLAAAGNSGGELETPANVAGILPIAAGNTEDGSLCSYASYAADVLVGPGCGISISWQGAPARTDGGGSSAATAVASTLIALLRTLRPAASWSEAEGWLRAGANPSTGRPVINGERAAEAAGLGAIVHRARLRMLAATQPPTDLIPTEPQIQSGSATASATPVPALVSAGVDAGVAQRRATVPNRLPAPTATVRWRRNLLLVNLRTRSALADRLRVSVRRSHQSVAVTRTVDITSRRATRLRLRHKPARVQLILLPIVGDTVKASKPTIFTARRGGFYR